MDKSDSELQKPDRPMEAPKSNAAVSSEPAVAPEQPKTNKQRQVLWEDAFTKWTQEIGKKDSTTESHAQQIYALHQGVSASRLQAQKSCPRNKSMLIRVALGRQPPGLQHVLFTLLGEGKPGAAVLPKAYKHNIHTQQQAQRTGWCAGAWSSLGNVLLLTCYSEYIGNKNWTYVLVLFFSFFLGGKMS